MFRHLQMFLPDFVPAAASHGTDATGGARGDQRQRDAWAKAMVDSLAETEGVEEPEGFGDSSGQRKDLLPDELKDRDERLRRCVKMKFTVTQILEFAQTWPRPFHHLQNIRRRLDEKKWKAKPEKTQLPHDREIINAFIKIARDAHRSGYRVSEERREYSIGEGTAIRSDFHFVLTGKGVDRVRYLEVQLSRMTAGEWRRKLSKYLRYRKRKHVKPFRVLVLIEDRDASDEHKYDEVNKAYRVARELTNEKHPDLTLFLFDWLPDFKGQFDTVTEDIWLTNRHQREWML